MVDVIAPREFDPLAEAADLAVSDSHNGGESHVEYGYAEDEDGER